MIYPNMCKHLCYHVRREISEEVTERWQRLVTCAEERHKLVTASLNFYKTAEQVCSVLDSLEREYRRDEDWCGSGGAPLAPLGLLALSAPPPPPPVAAPLAPPPTPPTPPADDQPTHNLDKAAQVAEYCSFVVIVHVDECGMRYAVSVCPRGGRWVRWS